ncbi:MAG: Gfo/Idh/MocA family oxidoreductase [Bradyrhizobium sp.]
MIDCAIVGLGRWGRNLVEATRGQTRLKITRAVETDLDHARGFCAEHHLDLTGNLQDVLDDRAIDAVLLVTPHSLHLDQVIAAAAAGKQIFCEKPLALHRDHAAACSAPAAMRAWCSRSGITAGSGRPMLALRQIVASGELGTVLHVEGTTATNTRRRSLAAGGCLPKNPLAVV